MMTHADPTKKTWGGFRQGAGRPKAAHRKITPHRARPALSPRHPVHVVLRRAGGASLRYGRMYRALRAVLGRYLGRADFRVVHLSIQSNHIHLLVEAANKTALSRGMQSLAINFARAINATFGRKGKVFEHRYHATQIVTARQARNSLAYVLNNWRKHREDMFNETTVKASLDPYASGISFDGRRGVRRFAVPAGYKPLPVSPPTTSLLRSEWRWFGEIDPFECPGSIR
jgi:REP element-mobilizing transposase RayT